MEDPTTLVTAMVLAPRRLASFRASQGITGFPGLADHDAQAAFIDNGIPVPEFGSDIHFHRDPGHFFNVVLAHDPAW